MATAATASTPTMSTTRTPDGEVWESIAGLTLWRLCGFLLVLLVLSLLIANAIAFCLQIRRDQRIRAKTAALATTTAVATSSDEKLKPVPVTILTGFLGAGKTTLLNRILHTPQLPYKIMVLENEVGTISIDHTLLLEPGKTDDELAKEGIYTLQNGCMCCTARVGKGSKSELERILDYLLRIVNEQGFDYLLVESTGIADPGPIIETFLQLRASRFRLDAIVTMVDTKAIQTFYNPQSGIFELPVELQRQLVYADVVAMNKVDLVPDKEQLARVRQAITTVNDGAIIHECVNAQLDLTQIVGIDTFDAVKFTTTNGSAQNSHEGGGHHTKDIHTMYLQVDAAVDIAKLTEWLNEVTAEYARAHILRIKGVVALSNSTRRCILQCVLDTYTIAPSTPWKPSETPNCRIVVIGKKLNKPKLEEGFRNCLVEEQEESKKTV